MSDKRPTRLAQAATYFNVSKDTIFDFLKSKKIEIENSPNAKIDEQMYTLLIKEYREDLYLKEEADQISLGQSRKELDRDEEMSIAEATKAAAAKTKKAEVKKEEVKVEEVAKEVPVKEEIPVVEIPGAKSKKKEAESPEVEKIETTKTKLIGPKIVGKVDIDSDDKKKVKEEIKPTKVEKPKKTTKETPAELPFEEKVEIVTPAPVAEEVKPAVEEVVVEHVETKYQKVVGLKQMGKIDLKDVPKDDRDRTKEERDEKKKRKRIATGPNTPGTVNNRIKLENKPKERPNFKRDTPFKKGDPVKPVPGQLGITQKEIDEKIKRTKAAIADQSSKNSRQKIRRGKRADMAEKAEANRELVDDMMLKVTEFISVSELASLMNISAIEVIKSCMSIGVIVSINQRLDAEVIELVASEFGFSVSFISLEDSTKFEDEVDNPEDLLPRPPIVTIMGHVDHGKTSLLDYIRETNVVKKESGGITQHIGAYDVLVPKQNRKITFLDTPGHEAFTAMRARGAKLTDIAIIVIAADDKVMPQTREAISHAQSANVPMIFAFNKMDKPGANPEGVRSQLAEMNLLVESWGGKYQEQEISAKKGMGIDDLLEKILLESDMLELKANPNKLSVGAVIEASLDKGRGYVATVLVEGGTLNVGDFIVAGSYFGNIKAMYDHNGIKKKKVYPGEPVQILGLNGAPSAGERFKEFEDEQEAKQLASKRAQLEREQGMRTRKHITLDEIGRRLALGTFKELNVIIKGDVDGSVEALTDSLQKLSTAEINVTVLHRAVGPITESDVLLASASDAIIIGFQVRPNGQAKILAEKESIDIRLYSVIYQVIDEIRSAMEGMLEPTIEEKIVGNIEIKEVFKITKVGTIAGCYVLDGKVTNKSKIRVIREGIVTFNGELESLKRYKDDVKEVQKGQDCGLNIKNYNDIQVGDIIEAYEQTEVKRKL
ncbi:MAG: translation initiation factor IF-2 [Bacteroidetes bacterium]|nr:translation initiation factor IF-2 [Bacteroidota bacterium]